MKTTFSGYIPLNNDELSKLIEKAIFAFDTSSIFNLYRYKSSTSVEILSYLEKFKGRLFLPYIVGLEYHSNRPKVLQQQRDIYSNIAKKIDELGNYLENQFLNEEHSTLDYTKLNDFFVSYKKTTLSYLTTSKNKHPNYLQSDPIRDKLTNIFNEHIGNPIDNEHLEKLYKIGDYRFENKIPPGYKDSKNKEKEFKLYGDTVIKSKYSDYIIWNEIIELGKKAQLPIILITNEKKEDWCLKLNGYIVGPRPELITEFYQKTGNRFHLIDLKSFLEQLKSLNRNSISQTTIDDVRKVGLGSWKDEVVNAFIAHNGIANLKEIYEYIRKNTDRELTKEWQSTVRKTIYYHCSDRDLYLGKEDLFLALDKSRYQLKNN